MSLPRVAIKVDVDTDRGTARGVPQLLAVLARHGIRATFLFSLGPDHTGRAIRRIFRPGFFKKVQRTSVVAVYGWRTLLNGVLLPGPHIGRRHESGLRAVAAAGHEVGIHCYDHIRWQDGLEHMSAEEVEREFARARSEFQRIFGRPARVAGAAGWQANAFSLAAYDRAGLTHASDSRGRAPFRPAAAGRVFETPQLPTTLPTLDELVGRTEYPFDQIQDHYARWMASGDHVWTIHAELEGMRYLGWFERLLERMRGQVIFETLEDAAARLDPSTLSVCRLEDGEVEGRSGRLAVQGACG